jgi:hypothetical protein
VAQDSFGALEALIVVAIGYLAGIAAPIAALIAGVLAEGGLLTEVLGPDPRRRVELPVRGQRCC